MWGPTNSKSLVSEQDPTSLKYLYSFYLNGRRKLKKTPTIRPQRPPGMWGGHLPSWSWNRWNGYSLCHRCPACLSSLGRSCGHTAECASHSQPPGWAQKTVASEPLTGSGAVDNTCPRFHLQHHKNKWMTEWVKCLLGFIFPQLTLWLAGILNSESCVIKRLGHLSRQIHTFGNMCSTYVCLCVPKR